MIAICPYCGSANDNHDRPGEPDAKPEEGDVSICLRCGELAKFTANGLREPTADELADIERDEMMRAAMGAYWKARGVPMLSIGQPSTLGGYRKCCVVFFGEDSAAVKFLDWKARQSPRGRGEQVIADEGQMVALLGHIHLNGFDEGKADADQSNRL